MFEEIAEPALEQTWNHEHLRHNCITDHAIQEHSEELPGDKLHPAGDWLCELLNDVMAEDAGSVDHGKDVSRGQNYPQLAQVQHAVKDEWLVNVTCERSIEGRVLHGEKKEEEERDNNGVFQRLQALEQLLRKSQQVEVIALQRLGAEERALRDSAAGLVPQHGDVDAGFKDAWASVSTDIPRGLTGTAMVALLHSEMAFREEAQVHKAESAALEGELVAAQSAAQEVLQQRATLEEHNAHLLAEAEATAQSKAEALARSQAEEACAFSWCAEVEQAGKYQDFTSERSVIMEVRDIQYSMQINRLVGQAWAAWEQVLLIICVRAWQSFAMEWRWNCAERSQHVQAELESRMGDMNLELQSRHGMSQKLCRRFGDAQFDFLLRMAVALWSGCARDSRWENHSTGWKDYMWERFRSDASAGSQMCQRFVYSLRITLLRLCIVTWHLEVKLWRAVSNKQSQRMARAFTPSLEFQLSELAQHTKDLCSEVSDLSQARSRSVKQEHKLEQVARWWCRDKTDDKKRDPFRNGVHQAVASFVERQAVASEQDFVQHIFLLWRTSASRESHRRQVAAGGAVRTGPIAAFFGAWSRRVAARRATMQTRQQEAKHTRSQLQVLVEQRDALLEQATACEEKLRTTLASLEQAEARRQAAEAKETKLLQRGREAEEKLQATEALMCDSQERQHQMQEEAHVQIAQIIEQKDCFMQRSVEYEERLLAAESTSHAAQAHVVQVEDEYRLTEAVCLERFRNVEEELQASEAGEREADRAAEMRATQVAMLSGDCDVLLERNLESEEKLRAAEALAFASQSQQQETEQSLLSSKKECSSFAEYNMTCRAQLLSLEASLHASESRQAQAQSNEDELMLQSAECRERLFAAEQAAHASQARQAEAEERCQLAEERVEQLEAYVQNALLFFQPP